MSTDITKTLLHGPANVKTGAYLDVYELHRKPNENVAITQIFRQWADGIGSVRGIHIEGGTITDWTPYATAAPPTWYNLPLLNNFTHSIPIKYCRDGGGTVHISGTFARANIPTANESLAQLPIGFRPQNTLCVPIVQAGGWSTAVYIRTDGVILFLPVVPSSGFASNNGISFFASFPVAP